MSDGRYQVYVGDLDINVTKQMLMDHFRKKYHSVLDAKIIQDHNKMSKGYGFVEFSSYDESQRAITEMQGTLIKGKPVKVSQGQSRNSGHGSGSSKGASHPTGTNTTALNQIFGSTGKYYL